MLVRAIGLIQLELVILSFQEAFLTNISDT